MGRSDPEEGRPPASVKPPDGGWGWIVLLGCFVITGFSYAFPKAVSVYFKELMHDFHVGYSDTAWISSIMLAMLYGMGPVSSIMVNQFGCRPVMLVGGLLASSGMILASFTTTIIELYLTAGMLTGLGMALNFQPSLIMLGTYFDKRRPLANGLAAAGSPVFLSALSPLGQVLLEKFGWRGGFLIMGGLLLNCCTCGAVMRPLEAGMKRKMERVQDKYEAKEMLPIGERAEEALSTTDGAKKSKKTKKKQQPRKGKKLLDFSIFSNRGFVIYSIAMFIMVLGLFVPPILLVNYAKDIGVPDTEAAFLLSIIGFIDIFARPSCGMLAGLKWMRPHVAYLFSFAMLFNGLTDICSARANTYTALIIFCVFFGISYGMVGALQFEVLMAIVGSQKFSSAIGLVLLIEAIAVLIGPPSAGRLVDAFKNYAIIFYLAGSEVVLSSLFLAMATYCCLNQGKKTPQPEKTPSVGGGSDTEEAESEAQEVEDHAGDNHHLSHSTNTAVVMDSEAVNHVAEDHSADGVEQPADEGGVPVPGECNSGQAAERERF
ncbi:Monocarboxylate transporter 3 [Platysternon megacephalum]|uniref:Monocarboxylate transporter 3 n=1 Tax=Platysternon megacephalum TaxID=55544 RepID=A0A4D9EM15_9SAUR|nr:Monocarboxylate transporter 3 [Platysternon megacephalum]